MTRIVEIAAIMRCPRCHREGLSLEKNALRCPACDTRLPVDGSNILVDYEAAALPDDWEKMQAESIERYEDEHYGEDETIASLFGGFIAVTLEADDVVLDVGCGLFPNLPAYVRHLRLGHYIGLEPLKTPVERSYDCLVGAVAEALPLKDGSINAAVLSTSIDHIADIDTAISELKRVLAPGGRLYFWVGVYEPEILPRSKTFYDVLYYGTLPKRALRVALAPLEYAWLFWQMRKRKRNLERGIPLDQYHCRYYTQDSLKKSLTDWGLEQTRYVLIPGTGSVLVEARPRAAA